MPRLRKVAMVGSSGHARVALDIAERDSSLQITGLLDSFRKAGELESGYAVLGSEKDLPRLIGELGIEACFIAIGDNWQRHLMAERIRLLVPDLQFVTLVHPSAIVAGGVRISDGSILMAGTTVNSGVVIDEFCIVNTGASLDHDSRMDAFSSLGPGVVTGGKVALGQFSVIAIGAVVANNVLVGEHAVVGAGSVVLEDIPAFSIAHGIPAVVSRSRKIGEPYM